MGGFVGKAAEQDAVPADGILSGSTFLLQAQLPASASARSSAVIVGRTTRRTEPSVLCTRCSRVMHSAIGRSEVSRLPFASMQG